MKMQSNISETTSASVTSNMQNKEGNTPKLDLPGDNVDNVNSNIGSQAINPKNLNNLNPNSTQLNQNQVPQNQASFSGTPAVSGQNQMPDANPTSNVALDMESSIKRSDDGKGGTCLVCNPPKTFSKLANCRLHFQERHVSTKAITCSLCGTNKAYASSKSLANHMRNTHKGVAKPAPMNN